MSNDISPDGFTVEDVRTALTSGKGIREGLGAWRRNPGSPDKENLGQEIYRNTLDSERGEAEVKVYESMNPDLSDFVWDLGTTKLASRLSNVWAVEFDYDVGSEWYVGIGDAEKVVDRIGERERYNRNSGFRNKETV